MASSSIDPRLVKLNRKLQRLMGEAMRDFQLISPGDQILLGLSGGKDSLALLDLLGERRKRGGMRFGIRALHVRMTNVHYDSDAGYLRDKAARWDIPFHLVETGFEPDRQPNRTPCFLCSWNRRKTLFQQAQQLGCNKIAFGHHQDDILRTALMNLTFNGTFSTMPARISMRKFDMQIIRPLARIRESLLSEWAALNNYRPVTKECPFDAASNRTGIEAVTTQLENICPDYRANLWHALLKAGALVEDERESASEPAL